MNDEKTRMPRCPGCDKLVGESHSYGCSVAPGFFVRPDGVPDPVVTERQARSVSR